MNDESARPDPLLPQKEGEMVMGGVISAWRMTAWLSLALRDFTKGGFDRHSVTFRAQDMEVDLTGKHIAITGANQGIGFSAAKTLASKGAVVRLICRNRDRGEAAVQEIVSLTGCSPDNLKLSICDLSNLQSIRALVKQLCDAKQPLHCLVNNAGCMVHGGVKAPGWCVKGANRGSSSGSNRTGDPKDVAEGGRERDRAEVNFATNTLGTVVLTEGLLPLLRLGAPSRVITVSSGGMLLQGLELAVDSLVQGTKDDNHETVYAICKRMQVALTEVWARKHTASSGVTFLSMHPGWVDTATLAASMPSFHNTFKAKLRRPEEGADTVSWLAAVAVAGEGEKEGEGKGAVLTSGGFYLDRKEVAKHLPGGRTAYAEEEGEELLRELQAIIAPPQ